MSSPAPPSPESPRARRSARPTQADGTDLPISSSQSPLPAKKLAPPHLMKTSSHTEIPLTRLDHRDPELTEELLAVVADLAHRSAFIGGPGGEGLEGRVARHPGE